MDSMSGRSCPRSRFNPFVKRPDNPDLPNPVAWATTLPYVLVGLSLLQPGRLPAPAGLDADPDVADLAAHGSSQLARTSADSARLLNVAQRRCQDRLASIRSRSLMSAS